ncbi:MAG: hypothetical protein AAF196_02540 [Planctomycetota bacterium]
MRLAQSALLFVSLTASAVAQPAGVIPGAGIAVPFGSSLGGGDDAIVSVDLPFPFAFPDGTSVTSIDISTNGIVFPGGAGVIDPTESAGEFADRVAIAPFWHDLKDFDGNSSQIYFRTGSAFSGQPDFEVLITWLNVTTSSNPNPFTLQMSINRGGSFWFRYDDRFVRANLDVGLIGVSDGAGSPTSIDYSSLADSSPRMTPTNAFELFSAPGFVDFGRSDEFTQIRFSPLDPLTGFSVNGTVGQVPGTIFGRRACSCGDLGFTISRDGAGYSLEPGGEFDSEFASGASFSLPRGSAPQPFTSPFPVPIGDQLVSDWFIGQGVLSAGATMNAEGTFPGVVPDQPTIAPAAGDWRPFAAPNLWVHEIDVDTFSVTWTGMRQWDFLGASISDPPASTFQAVVSSNGDIRLAYKELNYFPTGPQALFVGVSDGTTPMMPETDFSAGPSTTSVPLIYEFFFSQVSDPVDFPRPINEGRTVELTDPARIGQVLRVNAVDPLGPQTHDLFVLGLPSSDLFPRISLGEVNPHLDSCRLLIDTFTSLPVIVAGTPQPDGTPIAAIPDLPELIGCELSLQALILNPASSPAILPTDELRLRIGQ